jgi:hypothetical protein
MAIEKMNVFFGTGFGKDIWSSNMIFVVLNRYKCLV